MITGNRYARNVMPALVCIILAFLATVFLVSVGDEDGASITALLALVALINLFRMLAGK